MRLSFLVLPVILFLLSASAMGQQPDHVAVFEQGIALKDAGRYAPAYQKLDSAAAMSAHAKDWPNWAEARIKAATCLGKDGKALEAIHQFEDLRGNLSEKFTEEERLQFRLRIDRSLAYYYRRLNAVDQALRYQIEVLQGWTALGADSFRLAQTHLNIAVRLLEKNDFVQARTYLQRGLALSTSDPAYQSRFYTNLGKLAMSTGQLEAATAAFEQAFELRSTYKRNDPEAMGGVLLYMASAALAREDSEEAQRLLSMAEIYISNCLDCPELWGDFKSQYAQLYQAAGETGKALEAGRAALSYFSAGQYLNRAAAIQHIENGDYLLRLDSLTAARESFQSALRLFLPEYAASPHPEQLPKPDSLQTEPWVIEAYKGWSEVAFRHWESEQKQAALEESVEALELAVEQASIVRRAFVSPEARLGLSSKVYNLYETAIVRALDLSKVAGKAYLKRAFAFAEQGKAAVLLEEIAGADRSGGLGVPADIRTQLDELELQYRVYRECAMGEVPERASSCQLMQDSVLRARGELLLEIGQQYPSYFAARYQAQPLAVEALQARLRPDEAVVEYFVGDENLVVFLITASNFSVKRSALPRDLNDNIRHLRSSISEAGSSKLLLDFRKYGYQLYEQIAAGWVNSLPEKVKSITIVPDGLLSYVPFEVLLSEPAGDRLYADLPYLIRRFRFSYGYSASLRFRERASVPMEPAKVLACALSFSKSGNSAMRSGLERKDLAALPFALTEAEQIGEHFEGEFLLDGDATEAAFRDHSSKYGILHLATHTIFNDSIPDATRIVFAEGGDNTDGYLHAYELYGLPLKADLTVLSACQTGDGELLRGEGVMSLGRAFTYAGCKSTVMTLWPLSDDASGEIMGTFYGYLADGKRKDEALHQAKIDYIEAHNGPMASPFYWAAFVQSGDTSPVAPKRGIPSVFWIAPIGSVPILILLVIFLRRRARRAQKVEPVRVRMK